jgi:DnaK suppressor protein
MTDKELGDIKKQISDDIEQTKIDINILDTNAKPIEVGCCLDHIARSDLQIDIEIKVKRLAELETKLNLLFATLKRVDQDDYGECITCGDIIAIQRLQAMPQARECIECASFKK